MKCFWTEKNGKNGKKIEIIILNYKKNKILNLNSKKIKKIKNTIKK